MIFSEGKPKIDLSPFHLSFIDGKTFKTIKYIKPYDVQFDKLKFCRHFSWTEIHFTFVRRALIALINPTSSISKGKLAFFLYYVVRRYKLVHGQFGNVDLKFERTCLRA